MNKMPTKPGKVICKAVLIVDDHPMLRRGLIALIDSEPDLTVVAEATSVKTAISAIKACQPDLVLVDLELDGSHGLDLIKAMKTRYPSIPALVLSMHDETIYADRSLVAGARGYITKQQLDETLLVAIRQVLDGERYLSNKLEARLVDKYLGGLTIESDASLEGLSDRELQVFRLIGQGQSTREIAEINNLSIKTIESHIEHIKHKLLLGNATELAHCAIQWVESGIQPGA